MTAAEMEALRRLPKAEVHLHLEGSLTPERLWKLAQRHRLPESPADLEGCRRLYTFPDFAGFIQAFRTASLHLLTPADYADLVTDLAATLQAQGVVYAEVFLSVGILLWRGLAVEPFWDAVEEARRAAEAATGVRMAWIFDSVRQFGPEAVATDLDWALRLAKTGPVIGIGIGGDEARGPATWFKDSFARARAEGLRTTAHAGETCGPESVWETLRELTPDRIGHGLHAAEDAHLVEELARRGVPVDVCPTSNFKTGAWPLEQSHPVRRLWVGGVRVDIGSDDPGIFGCSLLGEYAYLADHCEFSPPELQQLASKSFDCSFLSPSDRAAMRRLPGLTAADAGGDGGVGI